jgi:serine/threonine-protein kinase
MLSVGSLGHIRVLGLLGAGGLGEVFAGFDETLQRRVALKAIQRRHRLQPEARVRFLREARILSQLDHPNICRIYDYVEGEDGDFLVLELVDGENLGTAIAAGMRDPLRLEVAQQVAEALAAAHLKGVIHRDLKPQNVMVTPEGQAKVLDFGLARSLGGTPSLSFAHVGASSSPLPETVAGGRVLIDLAETIVPALPRSFREEMTLSSAEAEEPGTMRGALLGTLAYMSPEQARGEVATTASDMYSFGLLLQELFTGKSPRRAATDAATQLAHARQGDTMPVHGIDASIADLIARLKDPAPAARPTAVEALRRLRWVRDKPRRRLIRLAAAAATALLLLGGLKYVLDLRQARMVAERHRAQAEGLIAFMLGDLRDKLAPVGRLELLEDVGDKAMSYFASLPPEDRTDDELFRHSQALRQIGEVRMANGDLPAAKAAFADSFVLATELVKRGPERARWLLGLAHSHFWIGSVELTQGNLGPALEHNEEYRRIARRLVKQEPGNTEWRLEEGYADTNLAAIHEARGEADAALDSLRASIAIKEKLVAGDPHNLEWRSSLANGLSWLGSTLIARGDLAGARSSFETEEGVRRGLVAADERDSNARYLLAINLTQHGKLHLMLGETELGAVALRAAIDLYTSLVAQDPLNRDWQRGLAVGHRELGELLLAQGRVGNALVELSAAEKALRALVEQDPTNADWHKQLAGCHTLASGAALASTQATAAEDAARRAIVLLEELVATSPGDRPPQLSLGRAHLALGNAAASLGDIVAAREAWKAAYAALEPLAHGSRDVAVLDAWSRVLLLLGRREAAAAVAAQLTAAGYRRPDFISVFTKEGLLASPAADGS